MDLNKLYYFYITAKYQHVTRASEKLHIAQPALTKAIKLLEGELGVPLFFKVKRNIRLTPFGEHLKARLDDVFPVLDKLPDELLNLKVEAEYVIRINVLAAATTVTAAIGAYKKKNPNAVFHVTQNEKDVYADVSVITSSTDFSVHRDYEKCEIYDEEIFLAVSKNSRYGEYKEINLSEVNEEGFVNLAGSKSFRNICDSFCMEAGFKPNIVFETDSPVAVKNLIGAGAGIGFYPAFSWDRASPEIRLLPIEKPVCKRALIVGLHKNGALSKTAEDFYNYLTEYLKKQQLKSGRKKL